MKKVTALLMALFVLLTTTFAQGKQQEPKTKTVQKTQTTKVSKDSTHLNKDGSADKRFKENKTSKTTTTTVVKKDGTPDMRFKENKKAKKG